MVNETPTDRVIRLVLAVILFFVTIYYVSGVWAIVLYVISAILLITSITGFCLLYELLGINTKK